MLTPCFRLFRFTVILLSLNGLITGCANTKIADSEAIRKDAIAAAANAEQSPEELLASAQTQLSQALMDKLDFFAPLHLKQASDSLTRADKIKIDPNQKASVAKEALAAKTFIEKGYQNKALVLEHLKPTLDQIEILKQVKAPALLPDDYEDSIDDTIFVIKMIEGGDLTKAKQKQNEVIKDMIDVEIDTLKKIHLSDAKRFLDKADDEDADEFAEVTTEAAEKKMEAAEKFIETQYRDRIGVAREGQEALHKAKMAYFVALDAKNLVKLKPEEAERHVVKIMSALQDIASSLETNALEPDTFDNMAMQLKGKSASIKKPQVTVEAIANDLQIEVEQIKDESLSIEPMESVEAVEARELESESLIEEKLVEPETDDAPTENSVEEASPSATPAPKVEEEESKPAEAADL